MSMAFTGAEQDRLNALAPDALEVATPDCVADDFGGEIVVLNSNTGIYFSLTHLAAAVWRDLAAGRSVASIIEGVSRVDRGIAKAVATFIDTLQQAQLMRPAHPGPLEELAPESVALVNNGETRLTMQSFEDMKDLILADPIHDTDDQLGWPAIRRTDTN
jgi:Coenzyme PQQ synthesis protein D (PqqD)